MPVAQMLSHLQIRDLIRYTQMSAAMIYVLAEAAKNSNIVMEELSDSNEL